MFFIYEGNEPVRVNPSQSAAKLVEKESFKSGNIYQCEKCRLDI